MKEKKHIMIYDWQITATHTKNLNFIAMNSTIDQIIIFSDHALNTRLIFKTRNVIIKGFERCFNL